MFFKKNFYNNFTITFKCTVFIKIKSLNTVNQLFRKFMNINKVLVREDSRIIKETKLQQ